MQANWYRSSWCHKITALGIIASYFILLIFVHDTTYIWATLALIFVLFVTTFSFASNESPFLLQLRGTRVTEITDRAIAQQQDYANQEQIQAETRIWMTDIPPSYSFVMADIPPQTPPPSYGSAILMFPPPYVTLETKTEQEPNEETVFSEDQQVRRPLSISTQVSVSSVLPETVQLGGITFSTQVSVISGHSEVPPDLAVRARFFISRQVSCEDGTEDNNTVKVEKIIAEAPAHLLLLSRQVSREDGGEVAGNSRQELSKVERKAISAISRQFSREDGPEGIDLYKQTVKLDLRKQVLLSRQASREDIVDCNGNRDSERISLPGQTSMESITDHREHKKDDE